MFALFYVTKAKYSFKLIFLNNFDVLERLLELEMS